VNYSIAIEPNPRDDGVDFFVAGAKGVIPVSRRDLEAIIGRAIIDTEFRLLLFADPDSALAGYNLTEAELAALKSVDAENMDACAEGVGRRILRSCIAEGPSSPDC
jgi:hypothetical protein